MTHDHDEQIASAYQAGYNDAYFDGLYLEGELKCQCEKCKKAYEAGQRDALAKLMVGE